MSADESRLESSFEAAEASPDEGATAAAIKTLLVSELAATHRCSRLVDACLAQLISSPKRVAARIDRACRTKAQLIEAEIRLCQVLDALSQPGPMSGLLARQDRNERLNEALDMPVRVAPKCALDGKPGALEEDN